MKPRPLNIVFLGLSLSSSWGNGHATTYRSLLKGLSQLGHRLVFLERDRPWYAENRDLAKPDFCELHYYGSVSELRDKYGPALRRAAALVLGPDWPGGDAAINASMAVVTGRHSFFGIFTPSPLARRAAGAREEFGPPPRPL